jgi:hypothetical protein
MRCLAKDVLLLRAFASAGMYLPSRWLAMGIHVTISPTYYRFTGHGLFINLLNSFNLFKDRNVKGVPNDKTPVSSLHESFHNVAAVFRLCWNLMIMPSFICCMADIFSTLMLCGQSFNAVWQTCTNQASFKNLLNERSGDLGGHEIEILSAICLER